jgi:hypothetical protein
VLFRLNIWGFEEQKIDAIKRAVCSLPFPLFRTENGSVQKELSEYNTKRRI